MSKLMKLKKKDIEYLEKQGFQKGILQKGDYIVGISSLGKKHKFSPELFEKEHEHGLFIKIYRPLQADQVAFAFFGEKCLELGKNGKEIWGDFAKEVNKNLVHKDSNLSITKNNHLTDYFTVDGKKYGMNLESQEKKEEYCLASNISPDICMYSAANYAQYSDLAEKAKEVSEKIDKQIKKLSKIMKEIPDVEIEIKEKTESDTLEEIDYE